MKSIRNVKRVITVLLAVLICGNVFAAGRRPDVIDVKISNFHQEGSNVKFSLKFKAGSGYPFLNYNWSGLNIYLDIYDTNGALNTAATSNDGVALATFGIYSSSTTGTDAPGVKPANTVPLNIVLRRQPDDVRGDVTDTYQIVANYTIPVTGTLNPNAYIVLRETDAVGGPWGDLDGSAWSSALDSEARSGAFKSHKARYNLESGCPPQALWTGVVDNDWFDSDNWTSLTDASRSSLGSVPSTCTKVYIPGGVFVGNVGSTTINRNPMTNFPNIPASGTAPACDEITFFQGGQISGSINRLVYNKAHTQLHIFSPYQQGSGYMLGNNYWNFSKGNASKELSSGQWHMLSMPLQGVVSGDFGYGVYPLTAMRKFIYDAGLREGTWSAPYTTTTEEIKPGEGFAFFAYNGEAAGFGHSYYNNDGKSVTGTQEYGLSKTNGVIEFPTYDTSDPIKTDILTSHRIQTYDGSKSTFYDVYTTGSASLLGDIAMESYKEKTRSASDFKFNTGNVEPPIAQEGEILIGNPYPATIDFDAFYSYNSGYMENGYRLWTGTGYADYKWGFATSPGMTKYIAPMQGFFVNSTDDRSGIRFRVNQIAADMPAGGSPSLRSTNENGEESNIIRISIENAYGTNNALIAQMENASVEYRKEEDMTKLFSSTKPKEKGVNDINFSHLPEVYTVAGETPLSMNFINNVTTGIPIGVRTPADTLIATTLLKLTGMNNYNAGKIEFVDLISGEEIDITNESSFERIFPNGKGGYQNGRFFLRISQDAMNMDSFASQGLNVYKANEEIHVVSSPGNLIKQIRVYDIQGRLIYNDTDIRTDIYRIKAPFEKQQVLVVQVVTEKNTESVKIKN